MPHAFSNNISHINLLHLSSAGGQPDPRRSATAPVAAAPAALDMMPLHIVKQQSCPADLGQSSRGTPTHCQLYLELINKRGVVKHWQFIGRQLGVFAEMELLDVKKVVNDYAKTFAQK